MTALLEKLRAVAEVLGDDLDTQLSVHLRPGELRAIAAAAGVEPMVLEPTEYNPRGVLLARLEVGTLKVSLLASVEAADAA